MGHVYLAMHVGPGGVQKIIVIKQLREDFATSVAARAMFLDEARIATRLNHPNIVQTNEVVDEEDDLYLVMEFLDGQPLSRILEPGRVPDLTLGAKLRIIAEALEGLHYAHELADYDGRPLNVVHRDVSPQNIIVTYDGHVKLVDFGVAKAADATTVTESGVFKGKVRYSSPEQALCTPVDRRADVFAVGTILWEILAGRRLWQDQADASVLLALASGHIPRIRDAVSEITPSLEAICGKALANDVGSRYPTALAFRDALLGYLNEHEDETDIGRTLSTAFAAERRNLHAVIDTQVKAARETSTGGARTMRQIPLLGPDSTSASEKSVLRGGISVESGSHSRVGGGVASRAKAIGIAAVAVVGVAAAIALFAPTKKASPAAAPVPVLPSTVHLSLHATPPSALLVLDGKALASNPFEGDVTREDKPHRLSIRAEGFETRELDERFIRDVNVDVTLAAQPVQSAPTPAPSASAAPPPSVVPRTPPRAGPPPKVAPGRRIDEDDPYKR
jgi:eukaryotic-like serine/threonine-protein kinase